MVSVDSGHHESSPPFLATTALEEFWDTSKPLAFLGEWCCRYSRRKDWEALGGEILRDMWSERTVALRGHRYAANSYERFLKPLGCALNQLHATNHGKRHWRIVVGPWLQAFIAILYERYATIRAALDRHPDLTSAGLEETSYVIPADTLHFMNLAKQDDYNLQLYTRVLQHFGVPLRRRAYEIKVCGEQPPRASGIDAVRSWTKQLARGPAQVGQRFAPILIHSTYFPAAIQIRLALATLGRVWPIVERHGAKPAVAGRAQRDDLALHMTPGDDFESLAAAVIAREIPRSFVEDFEPIGAAARQGYPSRPRAILSANFWHGNEPFRRWVAEAAEQGTILLGMQHGGNYGSLDQMPDEDHEVTIADRYYSWGWQRNSDGAAVVPMPAAKLAGRKLIGSGNQRRGILYACTSWPRYQFQFPFPVAGFRECLDWQRRFLAALPEAAREEVAVRLHYEDHGWDIALRLNERFPGLRFGDWRVPFAEALSRCRLYVGDHLSTTFIEALATAVPSVVFWSPKWNRLRPEAEPYYEGLRRAGILYHNPEDAAAAVNAVYADVEGWWNEPSRQKARRVFCNRFARTSRRPIQEWMAEFRRVLRSSPGQLAPVVRRDLMSLEDATPGEVGTTIDAAARGRH